MQIKFFRLLSFTILGCLLSPQTGLPQQPRTYPDKCVQSGVNLVCADASKSIYPGMDPARVTPAPASTIGPAAGPGGIQIPEGLTAEQLYHQGALFNARGLYPQAAAYLYRCAQLNDARCNTAIGLAYFNAKGVPKDVQKAVQYVGRGALAGNRGAQYEIGYWFDEGEVFTHDAQKAFSWYMRSAQQNFDVAQTRVGIAYEFGDGVQRSRSLAIQWLMKAAAQGDGFSRVLADTLRNPRTPARFQNEDTLAAYMRATQTAAIGAQWPKPAYSGGGISSAIEQSNRRNAELTLQSQGNYSAAEQCHSGGSCP
jgi:TPR repeat protein